MIPFGQHKISKNNRHKFKKSYNLVSLVDKSIYIFALFAVAANVPQLLNIWVDKNTSGVSIMSWTGFLIASVFWLWYGLLHKEMPIIFINFLLILVQGAIVVGLLVN